MRSSLPFGNNRKHPMAKAALLPCLARRIICVGALVLVAGCNPKAIPTVIFPAKPPPVDQEEPPSIEQLTVNLFARDIVNPDTNGLASPVQVRLFLHSDPQQLNSLSFGQIFEFDQTLDTVNPLAVHTIRPGTVTTIELEILPEHKVLAAAAAFRDVGKAKWFDSILLDKLTTTQINFILSDHSITHTSHQ